jgi:HAD superfamily hydrolase (TIGR01484 family)
MDGTLTSQEKFTPLLLQTLTDLAANAIPVLIVTGRSAGWVQALVHYLPVAGAIAENGGVFYSRTGVTDAGATELLSELELSEHRQQLSRMFRHLQADFPQIQASTDNPFRLTDWTFDVKGLSLAELKQMETQCRSEGWGFTYSTVQCHIKPLQQEKSTGLKFVLERYFPEVTLDQVVTVGDSPNDQSLFDPENFPISVGVANIRHYADTMQHLPAYITEAEAVEGFCQLALLLQNRAAFASNS